VTFPCDLHSAAVFDSHIGPIQTYRAMVRVYQTRPHCVNQMGKIQSKPLAERYGKGTAGERHGMYESACNGFALPLEWRSVNLTAQRFCLYFLFNPISCDPSISLTRTTTGHISHQLCCPPSTDTLISIDYSQ
jgi:hypothetical protein